MSRFVKREMRRKDRAITEEKARMLLAEGVYGFLATVSPEGTPYGVPLNYAYDDDVIYFHCAMDGHKIENIHSENAVTFTVVGPCHIDEARYTTKYESVTAFAQATIVLDKVEKTLALTRLCEKYTPSAMTGAPEMIVKSLDHTCVVRLEIEYITGKSNI